MRISEKEAAARRAWRLAVLISGRVAEADEIVRELLRERPDLATMQPPLADRLVVLRVRERMKSGRRASTRRAEGDEQEVEEALAPLSSLAPQPREAWILHHVDGKSLVELARAMDCSRTAAERHLAVADAALRDEDAPDGERRAHHMRRLIYALDPAPFIERTRRARSRRRLWGLAIALLALAIASALVMALFRT